MDEADGMTLFFALGVPGAALAAKLAGAMPPGEVWVHESVPAPDGARTFARFADALGGVFAQCRRIVCVMPVGVVVRALAPLAGHKLEDPAVVVVDVGGRWAVSLLSGHEGGANGLAVEVANACGGDAVVTTTTDAARTVIAGVGCRKGVAADGILAALDEALGTAGLTRGDVRLLATAEAKRNEPGLAEAARRLERPLRFIAHEAINRRLDCEPSAAAERQLGLRAVAEPCALLGGTRTRLLLPKMKRDGVTVALARESCSWLE